MPHQTADNLPPLDLSDGSVGRAAMVERHDAANYERDHQLRSRN
jgi:hypothetical protein